jgi:hypothetical protein
MSGIGLGSGEMIHRSKPVIQKRPLLALSSPTFSNTEVAE